MSLRFDIAIVGAGMAGASLAAECARAACTNGAKLSIALLEAEDAPGYHATGRSAAFWEECYGGPEIVPLTLASGSYLREGGFLGRRGALYLAREGDEGALDRFEGRFADTGATFSRIDRAALESRVPGLRAEWDRAIDQPDCADIDVGGLHAHYLGLARKGGVTLLTRSRVVAANRSADGWTLDLAGGDTLSAGTLVNAAGAWADMLAQIAGARPLGIAPLRRTVVQLQTDPAPPADMPLCLDINGGFYFKPENGRLWLSPHDETPSAPCDAAPEEMDVALAIDRLEAVTTWKPLRVERKWAGLRSFAPDRLPVYGFDPQVGGFFWFAGQGGYGIQTAPAAARLGAQLLLGRPRDTMTERLDADLYAPSRFAP
ncbi:FAD-dependent oxidoreductase [Alteriqipengyuania sp. WL0013]|uniref:NAD(P)/FAD-dependent oxidoreductase n=1 Tax=Alteriqipengyuania sp. WL0013 TaxID=3110773 RepID=UPI002B6C3E30|nr:FAD-dependent oxidoreductase [Alteriqipengyuania sp. WL0013]MEB3415845.1 FAD-dependent oxidoreductase [Alteriqipengyuania sp. WL0013]